MSDFSSTAPVSTQASRAHEPAQGRAATFHLSRCLHNHFDNTRVKKGKVSLCCRDCGTKWRTPHPLTLLCPEFYETKGLCTLGSSCPYLHVHRFKCTERSPQHEEYVGEDRDELLRECAIAVFNSQLPHRPFPRDVMPQIMALYQARKDLPSSTEDRLELAIPDQSTPPQMPMPAPHHKDLPRANSASSMSRTTPGEQSITSHRSLPLTEESCGSAIDVDDDSFDARTPATAFSPMGSPKPPALPSYLLEPCVVTNPQHNHQHKAGRCSTRPLLPVTARFVPMQRTLFEQAVIKVEL